MSIPLEIQNKITELRKIYLLPEDQRALNKIEANLRDKIVKGKLRENGLVKEIIQDALKKIGDINFLLANDESLQEQERHDLYAERRVHRFWLNRFGYDAETYIQSVKDFLDSKLSTESDAPQS